MSFFRQRLGYRKLEDNFTPLYSAKEGATCVLHLQTRVDEKIIKEILGDGLNRAMDADDGLTVKQSQLRFVAAVEQVVRAEIVATTERDGHWKFPLAEGKTPLEIGKVSFTKGKARKFAENVDLLLDICYPGDNQLRDSLKGAIGSYREAIAVLRKKSAYTDDEIEQFQTNIDKWYCVWVETYGRSGCTNYIHMLSTGHIREEMRRLKCLYWYSQEGLEAVNALIKSYFFRRTSQGGGKGDGVHNRMLSIAKLVLRKMKYMVDASGLIVDDDGNVQGYSVQAETGNNGGDDSSNSNQ